MNTNLTSNRKNRRTRTVARALALAVTIPVAFQAAGTPPAR